MTREPDPSAFARLLGQFPDHIDGVCPVEYVRSLRDNPTERIAELEAAVRKLALSLSECSPENHLGTVLGAAKRRRYALDTAYDALGVAFSETLSNT